MFRTGQTNDVTFKVNVMGTSTEPVVRLVLGTIPELSYSAVRSGDGWTAKVAIPEGLAGKYQMRVEVVLNNRLFTPITKSIEIFDDIPVSVIEPEIIKPCPPVMPPAPIEADVKTENVELEPVKVVQAVSHVQPELIKVEVVKPEKKIQAATLKQESKVKPESLLRLIVPDTIAVTVPPAVVPKKKPKPVLTPELATTEVKAPIKTARELKLSKLASAATAPAKRMFERIVTDLPKPGSVDTKPVRVSISDIDAVTTPVTRAIAEQVAAVRSKSKRPVSLIKEHVFYE